MAVDRLYKGDNLPLLQYMPWIFSIWTALYLAAVFIYLTNEYSPPADYPYPISTLTKSDLGTYALYSSILTVLPHCTFSRYKMVTNLTTAVAFIISVMELQKLINLKVGLCSFIVATIIYRIVFANSTIDNFLICLILTFDVLSSSLELNYSANNYSILMIACFLSLYIWAFFVYGCIFMKIHNRISLRAWKHIRALMLLVENTKRENDSCLHMIYNRLPTEIVEYVSSLKELSTKYHMDSSKPKREPALFLKRAGQYPSFITNPGAHSNPSDGILEAAIKEEIILDLSSTYRLADKLLSTEGFLDRRKTAIIVIRREVVSHDDPKGYAVASLSEENFQNLLTTVAVRRKITFVRMFGGSWIGCVGFFDSWGADLLNCHSILEFASEVASLENGNILGKLSIAVEFGDVIGGFQDSFSFDLFGQEIRWLLMMTGLNLYGLIILGENIRKLTTGKPKGSSVDEPTVFLGSVVYHCSVRPPWKVNSTIGVRYLLGREMKMDFSEFREIVDNFAMKNGVLKKSTFYNDLRYIMECSYRAKIELDAHSICSTDVGGLSNNTRTRVELCFELAYPQYKGMYSRLATKGSSRLEQLTKQLWSQDIGIEFLTSVYERLGLDLNELTSSESYVRDTMAKIRRIVDRVCFPQPLRYVFLVSAYEHSPPKNLFTIQKPQPQHFSHDFISPYESCCTFFGRPYLYLKEIVRKKSGLIFSRITFKDILAAFKPTFYDSQGFLSSLPKFLSLRPRSFDEYVDEFTSRNSPLYRQQSVSLYCDEARLFSHNRVVNAMIYFFAHGIGVVSLYFICYQTGVNNPNPIAALFMSSFMAVIALEGRYQFLMFILLLTIKIVYTLWFLVNTSEKNIPWKTDWNVVGVHMMSYMFSLHDFRTMSLLVFEDLAFVAPRFMSLSFVKSVTYVVIPLLHLVIWGLLHNVFISFILEHVLIPAANDTYNRQLSITNAIRTEFCSKHQPGNDHLLRSRTASAIVAIHIKAIDFLSGFLEPRDLFIILRKLQSIIDDCISSCQLTKASQFSGVSLVIVDNYSDATVNKGAPSAAVQSKVIAFLKAIDTAMEAFNQVNNFGLPLGIAISYGAVNLSSAFANSYDVSGYARDIALAMASFQREGIFSENKFSSELLQAAGIRSSFYKHVLVNDSSKKMEWLEINGDLSKLQLKNFDYVHMLGKGGYGSVHLLREKESGVLYAIKSIALKDGVMISTMLKRECIILQMLQHPNVVSLKSSFISNSRFYMVMEYVRGGNLFQVIVRDKVSLQHLRFWFAELVLAVEYVHSRGIIHRDIKPANCMIGTDGHLKLADFGLSKIIDTRKNRLSDNLAASPGTDDASQLMSKDTHDKIAQFFPLLQAVNSEASRTALLITFDLTSDLYTHLRTYSFNVVIASNKNEVEKCLKDKKRAIHVIVVDVDEKLDAFSMSKLWWFSDNRLTFHTMMDSPQIYSRFYSNTLVYIFADCDIKTRLRFKSAGARECFAKPIVYDSLLETLQKDFGSNARDTVGPPLPFVAQAEMDQHCGSEIASSVSITSTTSYLEYPHMDHVGESQERDYHVHFAVGTVHFLAPEIITDQKYDTPGDWWACGITFYECLTQQHLFYGTDRQDVMNNIVGGPIDLSKIVSFGEDVHRLIQGLLQRDAVQRLGYDGAAKIKQQEFFAHINWLTLSQSDTAAFKPAQFVQKVSDFHEKLFFYGTVEDRNPQSTLTMMSQRDVASMMRFQLNRGRAKMSSKIKSHHKNNSTSKSRTGAGDWYAPSSCGKLEEEQPSIYEELDEDN